MGRASSSGAADRYQYVLAGSTCPLGGQLREVGFDIDTVAIPADEGSDRERVAQVVWPRPAGSGSGFDASSGDQFLEAEVEVAAQHPGSCRGDKERRRGRGREPLVALSGAGGERGGGGLVEGQLPGLVELGVAHGEHAVGEVDVAPVEPEGSPHVGLRAGNDGGLDQLPTRPLEYDGIAGSPEQGWLGGLLLEAEGKAGARQAGATSVLQNLSRVSTH